MRENCCAERVKLGSWSLPQRYDKKGDSYRMDILSSKSSCSKKSYRPQIHRYAPAPAPIGKKYCVECKDFIEIESFISKTGKKYSYCQECRNRKSRESHTLEKGQARFLLKNHGMTKEEYDQRLLEQGGVCAICGKPESTISDKTGKPFALAVDHCHETGKNRSLLCMVCNQLVGRIEHDPRVKKIYAYLEMHANKLQK